MVQVQQSPNDKRLYRHLTLKNGLQVLLISDPETRVDSIDEEGGGDDSDDSMSDEASGDEGSDSDEDKATEVDGEQHAKKAAAALAVGTGSFSDPLEVQGLSHYLEHMLFMGSEKYPDENEYDSYLAKHGGSSNAYTEMEYTNYHFDVKPDRLHGALDRFAQFFIAPLCKAEALGREVEAVNNEFVGVQQSDPCRLAQLRCHTAKAGHMYRKFTWGNRKSLVEQPAAAKIDVRQRLVEYYKSQYSAERMALAILGGEPLDTLEHWARELFSAIPSGRGPKRSFNGTSNPYEGGSLYLVPAVKQAHELVVTFQLPSLTDKYLAKAEDYLSNLVGHESGGSLLSALKARGWATGLSAGVSEGGYERNSAVFIFEVSITLTEAGLKAEPGLGLAAVGVVFEYLAMLRAHGPQEWLYRELSDIGAMKARFLEEDDATDYVTGLVSNMLFVKPEHALLSEFLFEDWRPELVISLLDLMTPARVRVDIQTSEFERLADEARALTGATESQEPWFGLPYISASIPEPILQRWGQKFDASSNELHLPPRNEFIPKDFGLRCDQSAAVGPLAEVEAPKKRQREESETDAGTRANGGGAEGTAAALREPPEPVHEEVGARLWHKLDRSFRTPRACAYFVLRTLGAYASARSAAAVHLGLKLLHDALNETTYMADVAGLQYDVWLEGLTGIEVKIDGFNDKLPLLTQTIFHSLADFKVPAESFGRVKEALERKYQNAGLNVDRHATHTRLRAIKQLWSFDEVLAELRTLQPRQVQDLLKGSLGQLHVEALIEGNLTAAESQQLLGQLTKQLGGRPLPAAEWPADRIAKLPAGSSFLIRQKAKNEEEENSAVEIYFQAGPDDLRLRAELDLLEQIASEPCFNTLRTKEQLGYSVSCGVRLTHNVLGFAVLVLSGSHAPSHLDARIEAFLAGFKAELAGMSGEEFDRNRESLISAKLQKDRSLQDQADRHWEEITNRRHHFDAREQEADALRDLTKADVLGCFARYVDPASQQRARLAVHVLGRQHAEELGAGTPQGVELVLDPEELRARLNLYPAPVSG